MGGCTSSFIKRLKPKTVLMVGLDAAGKTTILYQLKLSDVDRTIPTIGFNVETIDYKTDSFTIWDLGGQDQIKKVWKYYYSGVQAIIFVVDCNDKDRIHIAKEELHNLLNEEKLRDAILLVFANKQDLPNAMKTAEITDRLELLRIRSRDWIVQACEATSKRGLHEGLEWLQTTLAKNSS